MNNLPNLVEEKDFETTPWQPSISEQEVVQATLHKFRMTADNRNRRFAYFDGLTLKEYIEDSVLGFTTNVDEREGIEDWQSRINDQFTRNKVVTILSKVVDILPIAAFRGRGDEDTRRSIVLTNLYEYSEDADDYEEFMIYFLLEAIVKGTAIGYEGLDRRKRKVRNIKDTNFEGELTITEGEITHNHLYGSIVKLEEFYPSSVGIRRIDDMPYCFWAKSMTWSQFMQDWGNYEKSKYVSPYQADFKDGESRPYYQDWLNGLAEEGEVHILRYYNQETDEYVIIANGVWLNPLDGDQVSPLPFNHKTLPFYSVKYDFFGSDFFYGKSLPDKLKNYQMVLNTLTNMLLDQSFLTIFQPILTNGYDGIEDDYLRPGRRTPIDTQGLSLADSVMPLQMNTPTGWHQYILEYMNSLGEKASVDQVASGQAGVGDRTTAVEIRTATESVAALFGLFGRMVNYGLKRKAHLRAQNIMQFWADPESPMIQKILGEGGNEEFNKAFNTFKIRNTELTTGRRGTKIIEMYKDKSELPDKDALNVRSVLDQAETREDTEILALTPDAIRDVEYDVTMVPNPKKASTKEMDKAIQMEKVRIYMSFFPNQIDVDELAVQTAIKMGDDPSKIIKSLQQEQQDPMSGMLSPEGQSAQKGAIDNGMSPLPQGTMANNAVRGMAGGETSSNNLRELQADFLG